MTEKNYERAKNIFGKAKACGCFILIDGREKEPSLDSFINFIREGGRLDGRLVPANGRWRICSECGRLVEKDNAVETCGQAICADCLAFEDMA